MRDEPNIIEFAPQRSGTGQEPTQGQPSESQPGVGNSHVERIASMMRSMSESGTHLGYVRGTADALRILIKHGLNCSPAYSEIHALMTCNEAHANKPEGRV